MHKPELIALLRDGQFHSGEDLATALNVSRTAVWKQLQKLDELGLAVESVKGTGYRIPGGLELLDEGRVRGGLDAQARGLMGELAIHWQIDSTNAEALRRVADGAASGLVCTAEQQTAGRGRRGRQWVSPFARNIYLSLVWEFNGGAAALEGLSLATGVAVAQSLQDVGVAGVQLKWPNDILFAGEKLGGILLEMSGDAAGTCQVVVGIGLNVAMPAAQATTIDQPWTDLESVAARATGRNELLSALLNRLLPMLNTFGQSGFAAWRDQWLALDANADANVVMQLGDRQVAGIARGVDERGAMRLETTTGIQLLHGGEISLRPAS